jgi:type III pantothenate kinase
VIADVVVDVGNSRIKWGRCTPQAVTQLASLPATDPVAWADQLAAWHVGPGSTWVLTGVHPDRRDFLAHWLVGQHQNVQIIQLAHQLPLQVKLQQPDRVGVDRLLNAVAVNTRRTLGRPAIIVDAGSAVTVDWLDETGAFRGGAIAPGLRLLAHSLHTYTALLPLVEVSSSSPRVPGTSTREAIEAGVFWFVAGGVNSLIERMASASAVPPDLFLGGGDALLLEPALKHPPVLWPLMTLEGVRLTALHMNGKTGNEMAPS